MLETVDFKLKSQIKLLGVQLIYNLFKIPSNTTSLFIVGMHRSGTSCLTGILEDYGIYLGRVSKNNPYNKKGSRENRKVNKLNNALLNNNNCSWYSPGDVKTLPLNLKLEIERIKLKMLRESRSNSNQVWAIKDPRMVFCWPAWSDQNTTLLGTFRHPNKVAKSLYSRAIDVNNNLNYTVDDWEELWFQYNSKLIDIYKQKSFTLLNFDWETDRYNQAVNKFINRLFKKQMELQSNFLDENLIHQEVSKNISNPKHKKLYDRLLEISSIEEEKLNK